MTSPDGDSRNLSAIPIHVLIVDDDEPHAEAVAEILGRAGCECTIANSGQRGAALIDSENFDVVVTDLKMDEIDGLAILRKTKEELPEAEVVLLTGHGTLQSALAAGQHGAQTYLTKPIDVHELRRAVEKAGEKVRLIRRNAELNRRLDEKFGFEGVVGNSSQMQKIIDTLKLVSPTDSTVLINGENGTGKELVARALHQNSARKSKRFVAVNISAIPESILESELFGHEAGAYTGATSRRIGRFEYANGGTLFLDEVGEMPVDTQVRLLRVLEERKVIRLGSNDEISINVRVVAATNADLKSLVKQKRFRIDLYHRLNVITIQLPPLRDRPGDIPLLMDHFCKQLCDQYGKQVQGFSRTARQAMMSFDWPGNIRELRNAVERMIVLDTDGLLDVDDLPDDIAAVAVQQEADGSTSFLSGADSLIGKPMSDVEKYYIQRTLELTDGKRSEAAQLLGIGERTLFRKIKEYGLK